MDSQGRYAIYFAPEEGTALARFGRWWLGRDAANAEFGALPPLDGHGVAPARQAEIVADARRYGFHATLKAPFRLAEGATAEQLYAVAAAFARRAPGFAVEPLRLGELDGFLALRPGGSATAIAHLAESCVRDFDGFRAPASPEELARRLDGGLSPRQEVLLAEWGYPYVFDQYRFHVTLTARLDAAEREALRHILAPHAAAVEAEPLAVRSICVFVQTRPDRPFVLARRFPLAR